jgi:hypothetical protein
MCETSERRREGELRGGEAERERESGAIRPSLERLG